MEHFWNDPIGNSWLLDQGTLRPGQVIDALRFRTNTHGTRVAILSVAKKSQMPRHLISDT